jgi:hypothetical protein
VGPALVDITEPATGFSRIQENGNTVRRGQSYHGVGPAEIGRIRIGERVGARAEERLDTFIGAAIAAAAGIPIAEQVDPRRVDAVGLAVGEIGVGLRFGKLADQALRAVAHDQVRLAGLVK